MPWNPFRKKEASGAGEFDRTFRDVAAGLGIEILSGDPEQVVVRVRGDTETRTIGLPNVNALARQRRAPVRG